MCHVVRSLTAIRLALAARRDLLREVLALHHQLAVLARSNRRFRAPDASAVAVLAQGVAAMARCAAAGSAATGAAGIAIGSIGVGGGVRGVRGDHASIRRFAI
jgi:hypothetical protein